MRQPRAEVNPRRSGTPEQLEVAPAIRGHLPAGVVIRRSPLGRLAGEHELPRLDPADEIDQPPALGVTHPGPQVEHSRYVRWRRFGTRWHLARDDAPPIHVGQACTSMTEEG